MVSVGLAQCGLGPQEAAVVADMIRDIPSVTKLSLAGNKLEEKGTKAVCDAVKNNKTLREPDLSGDPYGSSNIGGAAGAKHVADMLAVNASMTTSTPSVLLRVDSRS